MRWALTPPFHPYPTTQPSVFLVRQTAVLPFGGLFHKKPSVEWSGGLFSVALVVGLHPPAVSWHVALCSPDFPPSDRLI